MTAAFCDSSALVKLVVDESESAALRGSLQACSRLTTSTLSIVEVSRAARRRGPGLDAGVHGLFQSIETIELDDSILRLAALLDPPELRSLDAIQVATALSISEIDFDFIAYDKRILRAAAQAGLRTLSPA